MAKECILEVRDEVNVRFHGLDVATRRKLVDKLKFFIPHARHTPAYKLGRWDGTVSFCDIGGRTYINLITDLIPIIQQSGYKVTIDDKRIQHEFEFDDVDENSYSHVVWPEGHPAAGQSIILREHQVEMINSYLANIQSINVCPTAGGKTIVCAVLSDKVEDYGKSVVIVPSKDLVTQTEEDYINFGLDVGVYFGDRKDLSHQHTICTWQSLESLTKKSKEGTADITIQEFLEDVICVMVDEVHKSKATVLRKLLSGPFAHVPLRWGLTGTLPEEDHEKVAVTSCIGPALGKIKASDLQEQGYLANLEIEIWQMKDFNDVFDNYQSELKWLTSNRHRIEYISSMVIDAAEENGNTLILVDRIETGKLFNEFIPDSVFIDGSVKSTDRKKEYKSIQDVNGKIIIATYGVASTGISINRLFNLVLFEPGKSFIRVIQSIGRGLRVADDKDFVNVYDVSSTCKYSKRHLAKRKKHYKEAEYPFKIKKIEY